MGFRDEVEGARAERNDFFAHHYSSPLAEEDRASFDGLDYFAPDEAWSLEAEFQAEPPGKVDIPSSVGTSHPYTRLGWATVSISGRNHSLAVFDDGDGNAFIPFTDGTNQVDTYAGGRYVDLIVAEDGSARIDFNGARNPYCVYDEEFVCPLPPASNHIPSDVPAGEKRFRRTVP